MMAALLENLGVTDMMLVSGLSLAAAVIVGLSLVRFARPHPLLPSCGVKGRVAALYSFPVKSCAAIKLEEASVGECGIQGDREWMIVRAPTAEGEPAQMLTARDLPTMLLIQPSFALSGELQLTVAAGETITVSPPPVDRLVEVTVWRTTCTGVDQGKDVSKFLSAYFGCPDESLLLLRMPDHLSRPLAECSKYQHAPAIQDSSDRGGNAKFSDWAQFNVLSTASLRWLNRKTSPVEYTPEHFRANIIVDTIHEAPFQEDSWDEFSIGRVRFQFLKLTGRCLVPTIDPWTGERDKKMQPLKTLMKLRGGVYHFLPKTHPHHENKEAFFAMGARHFFEPGQTLRVGDEVEVLKTRDPRLGLI